MTNMPAAISALAPGAESSSAAQRAGPAPSRTVTAYRSHMRFVWAAVAVAPFLAVAVGMLTGRVRARSCCAVPAKDDVRLQSAPRAERS